MEFERNFGIQLLTELTKISMEKIKTKTETGETPWKKLLLVHVQFIFHNFSELATSDVRLLYTICNMVPKYSLLLVAFV